MPSLNIYQKRQAALLYHFTSMAYLDAIIERVRALTAFTDKTIDYAARVERDKVMREVGWRNGYPTPNYFKYGHPRLNACLRGLLEQKRLRVQQWFDISGVRGTLTGIEYFPVYWDSEAEEQTYYALSAEASRLGSRLDSTVGRRWTDYDLTWLWGEHRSVFPKIPRFRIRTDIEGETGKPPPRTGVYVPQDDPFGTLQFAWTAHAGGALQACETLSELAREYVALVGRDRLWRAPSASLKRSDGVEFTDEYFDTWCRTAKNMTFEDVISSRNERAEATRPCKWYLVEPVEGEFDDDAPPPGDCDDALVRELEAMFSVRDTPPAPVRKRRWLGAVLLLLLLALLHHVYTAAPA